MVSYRISPSVIAITSSVSIAKHERGEKCMRMIVPNLSILFFFFEILPCSYNATVRFREENRGRNRSKSTCTGSFMFDFVFLPLFFSPGFLDILFLWDHIQSKASSKKKVVFNQTTSAWTSLVLPSIYGHRNPINADCVKEKQTKIKAVETRWCRQIKQFKKIKRKKTKVLFLAYSPFALAWM